MRQEKNVGTERNGALRDRDSQVTQNAGGQGPQVAGSQGSAGFQPTGSQGSAGFQTSQAAGGQGSADFQATGGQTTAGFQTSQTAGGQGSAGFQSTGGQGSAGFQPSQQSGAQNFQGSSFSTGQSTQAAGGQIPPGFQPAQAAGGPQVVVVEKKKNNKLIGILLVLLLLVIAGLLVHQFWPKPSLERELTAKLGIMPGMTEEEIQDILNRQVAEGMLNVSMNPMPVFPTGKSEGNLQIQNIQGNHYSVKVTIVRSDNNQTILTTNLIDPGYYVKTMKLDKPLPKGKYVCVANFDAYDPKTLDFVGSTGMQILITVQK